MMKKALISVENSGLNGEAKKSPYFTKTYLLGFALLAVGSIGHVVVMPFCNIVLLSTSTATGIIMSTFLSIMYLGEKPVGKYDITSTTLIVTGCLAIVFLSNYEDITFTADDIAKLLRRPVTICFLSFFVFSAACTYLFWQWFQKTIKKFNAELNTWMDS